MGDPGSVTMAALVYKELERQDAWEMLALSAADAVK